jgi:hypothetical protein
MIILLTISTTVLFVLVAIAERKYLAMKTLLQTTVDSTLELHNTSESMGNAMLLLLKSNAAKGTSHIPSELPFPVDPQSSSNQEKIT